MVLESNLAGVMCSHFCPYQVHIDLTPGMLLDKATSDVRRFLLLPSRISVLPGETTRAAVGTGAQKMLTLQGSLTPWKDSPRGLGAGSESEGTRQLRMQEGWQKPL